MVKAPTPEEEDRRRLCRERKVLIGERVRHVNRDRSAAATPIPRPVEVAMQKQRPICTQEVAG
jgi:hypothetical protein